MKLQISVHAAYQVPFVRAEAQTAAMGCFDKAWRIPRWDLISDPITEPLFTICFQQDKPKLVHQVKKDAGAL